MHPLTTSGATVNAPKSNPRQWQDIGSDVNWADYGGMWARPQRGKPGRYWVIQFENRREWGDGATGYHVQLHDAYLDNPQRAQALESSGIDDDSLTWQCVVYCLQRYGATAPVYQESGNNAHRLVRFAKAEAVRLESDSQLYQDAMDQPVNRIGTSAANYGDGVIFTSDRKVKL